ncbi:MAG: hypothetical protein ACK4SL_00925 [Candidatus Paceibacteria bacterium]
MKITHADKHRWIKYIHPDILPDFGKNNTKKITVLLNQIDSAEISHTITPATNEDIQWFEAMYLKNLQDKHNPKPHNIFKTTLGKEVIKYPYFILTLREKGQLVGGTIFTMRPDRLSIAYRTYPLSWLQHQTKCSPALYAEYIITAYALDNDLSILVHGVDHNPYGVNSHIGVAIFKLAVGCYPDIVTTHSLCESDLQMLPFGSLVLLYPESGERITKAYLIGDTSTAEKYEQVFKYPQQLQVTLYTPTL